MIRSLFIIFLFTFSSAQVIKRLQQNPRDLFVIKDWKSYSAYSRITGIVESHSTIYFATNGAGLLRYDKFERRFKFPLSRSNGIRSNDIRALYTAHEDSGLLDKRSVLLETSRGPQVISLDQSDNFYLSSEELSFFQKDKRSLPLEAIREEDRFTFDIPYHYQNGGTIRGDNFEEYRVSGKYVDSERGIWLIVNNLGFFYAESEAGFFRPIHLGPISNQVRSLTYYNGDVFLALSNNSRRELPILARWSRENSWKHWRQYYVSELRSSQINKVLVIKDTLWLGGNFGLASYTLGTNEFRDYRFKGLYDNVVYDIFAYKNELLFGTDKGLWIYQAKSKSLHQLKFKAIGNVDVFSVAEDDRYIFAVSRFGVYKIDKKNESISLFNNELDFPSIKSSIVRYIDGKFYFNNTDGIFFFDPERNEKTQIVLSSTNFQLDISDIELSGDNIFLATNKGLLIYYKKTDEWVWITKREGLPSNQLNDIELAGDFLLIASTNGVSEFYWRDESRF